MTAAHCLLYDPSWQTWTVRASNVAGAPSATAHFFGVVSDHYDAVENGDVGVLLLAKPIHLPAYGILTDIGAAVDRGEIFNAVAVGRAKETPLADVVKTKLLHVSTAASLGYVTGLKTEYYSDGGDSGGGLFPVEDGRTTHKVVGFERQPDPANGFDFFTRVDARLRAVVAKGSPR